VPQVTDDDLWQELASAVLLAADAEKDKQDERPYDDLKQADRVAEDAAYDPFLTQEKGLEGKDEDAVTRILEEELLRRVDSLEDILREWNARELEAKVPIYQLIRSNSGRYRLLVALWGALGSTAFEEFVKTFAGAKLKIPTAQDYQKFEQTRQMLALDRQGKTQAAIGHRFHLSQSGVSLRLSRLKAQWERQEGSFLSALNQMLRMLVRVTIRNRLRRTSSLKNGPDIGSSSRFEVLRSLYRLDEHDFGNYGPGSLGVGSGSSKRRM